MDLLKNIIRKPKTVAVENKGNSKEKTEESGVVDNTKKRDFSDGLVSIKDIIAPSSLEVYFNRQNW